MVCRLDRREEHVGGSTFEGDRRDGLGAGEDGVRHARDVDPRAADRVEVGDECARPVEVTDNAQMPGVVREMVTAFGTSPVVAKTVMILDASGGDDLHAGALETPVWCVP